MSANIESCSSTPAARHTNSIRNRCLVHTSSLHWDVCWPWAARLLPQQIQHILPGVIVGPWQLQGDHDKGVGTSHHTASCSKHNFRWTLQTNANREGTVGLLLWRSHFASGPMSNRNRSPFLRNDIGTAVEIARAVPLGGRAGQGTRRSPSCWRGLAGAAKGRDSNGL